MKTILLIMIGLSSLSMGQETQRFTKTNGVVSDSKTTLEWQDNYSDNANSIKSATWIDALGYCEGLSLNNQSDWRLANKKELLSIVDYGTYSPAISSVFEKTASYYYWSSTSANYAKNAWYIYFYNGYTSNYRKVNSLYVRCVRAGQ